MEASEPEQKRSLFGLPGPSFWVAASLLLVASVVLAFIPLFNLLAYEFCAAISLLASMTSGPVAVGWVRKQPDREAFKLYAGALALNLITLALPLLVILLNAIRVQNCNLGVGFMFFLLLPVPTVLIWSAPGIAIGLGVSRRILGGLAFAGLWLLVAIYNIWEFWAGPQMDSYNQLVGWVAGPIFDEVVEPGGPLLYSRFYGMAWAGLLLTVTAAVLPKRNRRNLLYAGLFALLVVVLWQCDSSLGFGRSRSRVESVLSGRTETANFVIHHAPDLAQDKVNLLARDHEFRLSQIQKRIGPVSLPRLHSYVFPNAKVKRDLVGAGRTQYAKPWDFSMYLNGANFPHATLRHELTHLVAGAFGSWPFRTSARLVFWQNMGLIEGLAVAVDWPTPRFDPHTWSAAQRRLGKAPPVGSLFDPLGFWTKSARRSYTLAGSFSRYLIDRYGPERFRQAYRAGSLEGIYSQSPGELIREFEEFLDNLPLEPDVVEAARLRFSATSIFKRVCAHEISALYEQARGFLAKKKPDQAAGTIEEILSHVPEDPNALELLAKIRVEQKRFAEAQEIYRRLLERSELGPARLASIGSQLGDLLAGQGQDAEAARHYRKLLSAHLDDASDRLAAVKLQVLELGEHRQRLLDFLTRGQADASVLLDLREVAADLPEWSTAWYLLGRQLFNRNLFKRSIPYLQRAGRTGLAGPDLAAENLRLLSIAHYHMEDYRQAAAFLAVLAQNPRHPGELAFARDWLERIRFDLGRGR